MLGVIAEAELGSVDSIPISVEVGQSHRHQQQKGIGPPVIGERVRVAAQAGNAAGVPDRHPR
jgi:hypothetical protein